MCHGLRWENHERPLPCWCKLAGCFFIPVRFQNGDKATVVQGYSQCRFFGKDWTDQDETRTEKIRGTRELSGEAADHKV